MLLQTERTTDNNGSSKKDEAILKCNSEKFELGRGRGQKNIETSTDRKKVLFSV